MNIQLTLKDACLQLGRIKTSEFHYDDAIEFNVASAALELIRKDVYDIENFVRLMHIIGVFIQVQENAGNTEAGDDLSQVIYALENVKDKVIRRMENEHKKD